MEHKNIKISGSFNSPQIDYDFYFGKIIPKFIIEDGIPKIITHLHEKYHLEGFIIKRLNNKLAEVKIIGNHPNANINTDELCLQEKELGATVLDTDAFKNVLINRLITYYFDHSYYRPNKKDYKTEPVDDFIKINVDFEKGEIYNSEAPFKRLYPDKN